MAVAATVEKQLTSRPSVGDQRRRHRASHTPGMNSGQRGWKAQPVGRLNGMRHRAADRRQPLRGAAMMLGIERSSARV